MQTPSFNNRAPSEGFTLTELLTVIAIIGVLSAILIPLINSVRQKARVAEATANLRELNKSALLYANEHKNQYPDATNGVWVSELWQCIYPKRVFDWNTYTDPGTIFYTPFLNKDLPSPRSWAMNYTLTSSQAGNRRYALLPAPARTMIYGDSNGSYSNNQWDRVIPPRTDGKIAFAFLDGHIALLNSADVPVSGTDIFWNGTGQ